MLEKITKAGLKAIGKQFWLQTDTGEFTWRGRAAILAIAFSLGSVVALILGSMITSYLPELLDHLLPDDGTNKYLQAMAGAWSRLAVTAVATVSSILIFLGLWVIRTHDKKIEFRNHQKQLSRSQIEKAGELLVKEDDPVSRGLGAYRLTHLYREKRIDEAEYQGYMTICSSWASPAGSGKVPMTAIKVNLKKAYLVLAQLQTAVLVATRLEEANLEQAVLIRANLLAANLEKANLAGADLTGADLTKADLTKAILTRADMPGIKLIKANLTGANLTGANLEGIKLVETKPTGPDLAEGTLAKVSLPKGNYKEAGGKVALAKAKAELDLGATDPEEAPLAKARAKAYLTEAQQAGANPKEISRLRKIANLGSEDLIKANLTDANLTDADLTGANLAGANLTGANLAGANLTRANLTGANLTGANLTDADLTRADLRTALVTSCEMTETQKQLFANQGVNVEGVIVIQSLK